MLEAANTGGHHLHVLKAPVSPCRFVHSLSMYQQQETNCLQDAEIGECLPERRNREEIMHRESENPQNTGSKSIDHHAVHHRKLSCNLDSNDVVDAAGTGIQEQHEYQPRVAPEHRVGVEDVLQAPIIRTRPLSQKHEDWDHGEETPDSLETNELRAWHIVKE